jgi:uncharacterized protein (TIGR03067 family)
MSRSLGVLPVYALAVALSFAGSSWAQKPGKEPPPSAEEEWPSIEGKWHVLLAHEEDKNLLDRPEARNSVVTISDKQLQWTGADGKPLFSAACTWKQEASPKWLVDLKPEGVAGDQPELPGVACLFEKDVLKISWRRQAHLDRGRPKTFAGDRFQGYLLLTRAPLGSPPSGQPNLVGQWKLLTALDDSLEKIGGDRSTSVVEFGPDTFALKGRPEEKAGGFAGGYTLDTSARPTRIKFKVTTPPPGTGTTPTPLDGFVPGIVEFLDEDTAWLCYRESGWGGNDPPESRKYPESFFSDGNMNLWIFQRSKP